MPPSSPDCVIRSRDSPWDTAFAQNGFVSSHDCAMFPTYSHHRHHDSPSHSSEGEHPHTRHTRPITPITPIEYTPSNYKKLFHDASSASSCASPQSNVSSDHSRTQSPPSAWTLSSQSDPSAHGQSGVWTQASTTDRSSNQFQPSQPRLSSFVHDSQTRSYHLDVVQHPQRTAEFGSASLSRLPLGPAIIVQLIVRDRFGNLIIPEMELPFLLAHLSLFSDDGMRPLDMGTAPNGETPPRRLLYGNLVASPQTLRNLEGRLGLFFLFSDVSIRWRGRFQLGISLLRISQTDASGALSLASHGTLLAQARTRPFDVVAHESYVAPATTRLTQSFLRQGARI
ncbi:velvet factor-domain-containing protein [Boletus edulis]|uniref:Velvet factor-domain-containing protein n=1 Tax=Boletus edulis BED1 TaxID=1328754 RepID=A0AAD4GL96_BOLED|nr:velvet factor-domain-containing protein [Boletus edulis]KAF8449070.1 velvet factor-domain-containing protein [Boletus edulis BED1]